MGLRISVTAFLLVPCIASAQQYQGSLPRRGFVPDSATAVRIAVAVWIPLYGERAIKEQQPFVASLNDSVWTVTANPSRPPHPVIVVAGVGLLTAGGIPVVKIAQRDARILLSSEEW